MTLNNNNNYYYSNDANNNKKNLSIAGDHSIGYTLYGSTFLCVQNVYNVDYMCENIYDFNIMNRAYLQNIEPSLE